MNPHVAGGSFWRRFGYRPKRQWGLETAPAYVKASILLETVHGASFLFLLVVVAHALWIGEVVWGGAFMALDVVLNLCPMMVRRYRRLRLIAGLQRRQGRRPASRAPVTG